MSLMIRSAVCDPHFFEVNSRSPLQVGGRCFWACGDDLYHHPLALCRVIDDGRGLSLCGLLVRMQGTCALAMGSSW